MLMNKLKKNNIIRMLMNMSTKQNVIRTLMEMLKKTCNQNVDEHVEKQKCN